MLFPFICLFVLASPVSADGRCGTDDFGNVVCMDRDGAVNTVRPDSVGKDIREMLAPAGAGDKADRGGKSARPRCGEDPFGNRVCR